MGSLSSKPTSTCLEERDSCPPELEPSAEWESHVLESFSYLRGQLESLSKNPKSRERLINVPALKDLKGWSLFCLGQSAAIAKESSQTSSYDENVSDEEDMDGNINENVGIADLNDLDSARLDVEATSEVCSDNTSLKMAVDTEAELPVWTGLTSVSPTTSLLLQFDQVMTQRILGYHISWLVSGLESIDSEMLSKSLDDTLFQSLMSPIQSQWLYALLTRLEKPIDRDMESSIRALHRRCCRLRVLVHDILSFNRHSQQIRETLQAHLGSEPSSDMSRAAKIVAEINTLIVITGKYFGQGEHDRSYLVMTKTRAHDDHDSKRMNILDELRCANDEEDMDDDGEDEMIDMDGDVMCEEGTDNDEEGSYDNDGEAGGMESNNGILCNAVVDIISFSDRDRFTDNSVIPKSRNHTLEEGEECEDIVDCTQMQTNEQSMVGVKRYLSGTTKLEVSQHQRK